MSPNRPCQSRRSGGSPSALGIVLGLALLHLAVSPALASEEVACATCHAEVAEHSSVHAELFDCSGCHVGFQGFPHPEPAPAGQVCATCHPEATGQLSASVHAGAVTCQACHGPVHEIGRSTDRGAPMSPLEQFRTCGGCHHTDDDAEDDLVGRYLGSPHARALLVKGLEMAPSCSGCHGAHDVAAASDPEARLGHRHSPETCGGCHVFVLETWREQSIHGRLWIEGSEEGPVCTSCHTSHQVAPSSARGLALKAPESCGGCHPDHTATYGDSFHGQATSLGFLTGATCSDCHTPHRNLPASDPGSSVHPSNLAGTCGACHPSANGSFLTFDPHVDPTDPTDNPPVYYVWLFMTALLLGVFGFFAVHDLLWLQRALVGWWRGEFESRPVEPGPYVRRFSPVHVRVHVVVVVTFLVLAATGLPLKFHSAVWARSVADALGGIEFMRLLHRVAAIATFGYGLFHVGHLAYRSLFVRERGIFWGPMSLVPRPSDLTDLLRNLRFFLYLGPRPRLDRWSYWEKFDYFAVFWGIPIIGVSGLILWFPEFFTRWLPGWVLNAGHVVHSDEALLAVGFIFVFHFFHTHLRPESFPMDPVIFTGKMPLARFREERPLEYERLVSAGELESRLESAPSKNDLRRAHISGGIAVTIGLLLVVAIFWAALTL
ncbi:MAG: cytochrome c3 family protein [Myxococcota bacterium]